MEERGATMEHERAFSKTVSRFGWGLTAIGAINWGLIGMANFNLVHALFGRVPALERTVYTLVGIFGALSLLRFLGILGAHHEMGGERLVEELRRSA